jgi:CheY-like chemotaxis protein
MQAPVRTVLVVDHDPEFRCSLENALAPLGYQVLTADSVEAACAILQSKPVDAVLFESDPPIMSGIAFYDAVVSGWRSLDRHIAFVSNKAEPRDVEPWLKRHHCTVFRKPSLERLVSWVGSIAR